jgi:hypothetical protein
MSTAIQLPPVPFTRLLRPSGQRVISYAHVLDLVWYTIIPIAYKMCY